MTKRLFDEDAYIKKFKAEVLSCSRTKKGWETILDQTAFFPEGGGQDGDTGFIAGIRITDTQEKDGTIIHYAEKEIPAGEAECVINWEQRFSRMQNHSGEHIVSGLVHKKFGYDNVSFRLTDEETLFRFSGTLSAEDADMIEKEANKAVFSNAEIICEYPPEEVLKNLDYRSKLDLTEGVRIVTIRGYDVCACCAPHVSRTGEIGLIKIIDRFNEKGGTSLRIRCGFSALEDYRKRFNSVLEISRSLSAKQFEVQNAVERLKEENSALSAKTAELTESLLDNLAQSVEETEGNTAVLTELTGDNLRKFADKCKNKCTGIFAALSGDDENGYRYVLVSGNDDIKEAAAEANKALNGRGGGRGAMAQGKYDAPLEEIKRYFEN